MIKTTSSILSLFKSPFFTIILFQPLGIKSSTLLAFCGKFSANKLNEQKINNKDSFVLVFTQDGCSHCESYAPVLKEVSNKYNIKIYDLNLTKVKSTDIAKVNAIASISGTPTTIFYKNGEEETTLNRISGDTTSDKLIAKLQKLEYIKGE